MKMMNFNAPRFMKSFNISLSLKIIKANYPGQYNNRLQQQMEYNM